VGLCTELLNDISRQPDRESKEGRERERKRRQEKVLLEESISQLGVLLGRTPENVE